MSKKFKSQASSARAASTFTGGFGLFQSNTSPLSYVTEQPDLSQITEPNVVVAFKNLGKKDSTTKAKALEELQEACVGSVDEAVLTAWSDIYPRTSIDNSRRVRQLAHTLQGSLTVSSGRRIAPLLPKLIGPWLAGTFDNDKSVARTARDALERSFSTLEKRQALWKIYKDSIFDFVEDAITKQTKDTLSDERTTSQDDAEAKYVRVVGTGMHMLEQMLKGGNGIELLGKKLWEFVYHNDAYLRRGACGIVVMASQQELDWSVISSCFLSKGLHSTQAGSSVQYTKALLALTHKRPQLWTSDYTGKTSILKRLVQFLRQGSQMSTEEYWKNVESLLRLLPEEVLMDKQEGAASIVEALRSGVIAERVNTITAWMTYVQICSWLSTRVANKEEFFDQHLTPLVVQYVTAKGEWTGNARVAQAVVLSIVQQDQQTFGRIWNDLVHQTVDTMKLSLPETSKDFRASQDSVIAQGRRLLSLQGEIIKIGDQSILQQSMMALLDAAFELLRSRNGKPYGAAGIVELIVQQPTFNKHNPTLQAFLKDDISNMLDSPSAERLVVVSVSCGQTEIEQKLLQHHSTYSQQATYKYLQITDSISETFKNQLLNQLHQSPSDQGLLCASVFSNSKLVDLQQEVLQVLLQLLSSSTPSAAIQLLEEILSNSASAHAINSLKEQPLLLSRLLVISDSEANESDRITSLIAKLNSKMNGTGSLPIIQQQLDDEGTPLSIFTLIDLADRIIQDGKTPISAVLPSVDQWKTALAPHTTSSRPLSLSITSALQGVIYILKPDDKQFITKRDSDDFSLAFRLILYVTKLKVDLKKLDQLQLATLQQHLPLALQLINEKLTADDSNELWLHSTPEVLQEAADTLADGNKLLISWLDDASFVDHWLSKGHDLIGSSVQTYCMGLAWTSIFAEYIERKGPASMLQGYDEELKVLHRSENIIQSGALLAVLRDHILSSPHSKRLCNELVAGATDCKNRSIVLLNILLQGQSETLETVPTQRIVFMMKALAKGLTSSTILSETIKVLAGILPLVADIYGEHWEQILTFLDTLWAEQVELAVLNTSLRLYSSIKALLNSEDINEDLQEAFSAVKAELDQRLLYQLQSFTKYDSQSDQPRTITAELLRRQLVDVEVKIDIDLFGLLSSRIEAVQTTVYEILHREFPKRQEQLSLDLVLEKRTIEFPEELVVILDDNSQPRQYLLAWNLIFDHFTTASFKLREMYTSEIKRIGCIDKFLTFICDELRITGRPVDASRFDIQNFTIESDDQTQWLSVHNYYKCLLYLPGLTKDWFISSNNRVKGPLQSWTQKYISPLIVTASLKEVDDWANTQDKDDRPLTIKSSPRGSELVASIVIDPENPPISLAVALPGSYPLESPLITSRTRVGVSEKNWQSWMRTIQIIVFSTGSIIEGLVAFRRNVQGALKGQSECAICYSIIGTDMQTPNKKCGTCKNMFHGTCLFRWFKSSNSSSCPLCRNNFNYA